MVDRKLKRGLHDTCCDSSRRTSRKSGNMNARHARLILVAALLLVVGGTGCGKKQRTRAGAPQLPSPVTVRPGDFEYGRASWYGHPFHGRQTSSGETYDMHKLTAAHRTLPFGTQVEVTNMENERRVQVHINDRGPFVDGRIIDLSLKAAKAIRMVGPGTAQVRVRILRVPGNASTSSADGRDVVRTRAGRYSVQVGAFAEWRNADQLRARLARSYPQYPVLLNLTPDGARYRVWVGNEPSEQRAALIAGRLRQDQLAAFVVRLD